MNLTDAYDYKYYHEGFFGYSLTPVFEEFSLAHLLPILILVGAILTVYLFRKKIAAWKGEETLRFILGAMLILNEGFYYWRLLYVGNGGAATLDPMLTYLPFQVCEWSAYIAAFMLMKKSRHLFDVCYYVCLTLGAIPLFTPAVITYTGPTYARYYQFWIEHLIPIFAVFYMMFVHGFRANYRKVYKPLAVLSVLCTVAIIANLNIEGANFMYLAAGTAGDSIANVLPQNIWVRLGLYVVIMAVLFFLISLPHILPEIKAHRAKKAAMLAESAPAETPTETAMETPVTAEEIAVETPTSMLETEEQTEETEKELFAIPPVDIQ